jgi:hypothetical protein
MWNRDSPVSVVSLQSIVKWFAQIKGIVQRNFTAVGKVSNVSYSYNVVALDYILNFIGVFISYSA